MSSKMREEDCEYCDGHGEVCSNCRESEDDCICDDAAREGGAPEMEPCDECKGKGTIECEVCLTCEAVVDNCGCDDE